MGRTSYASKIIIIAVLLVLVFASIILHLYKVQIIQHTGSIRQTGKTHTAIPLQNIVLRVRAIQVIYASFVINIRSLTVNFLKSSLAFV